jgi:hypothetical protein
VAAGFQNYVGAGFSRPWTALDRLRPPRIRGDAEYEALMQQVQQRWQAFDA